MYQTKNLGLNITEIEKDSVQPFSFETDLGANFKAIDEKTLSHRNITNCLLEVPQNIKLELSDGTLTLKEGSKVYIPNGFEADGTTKKFDEFIVNNDILLSDTSGIANGKQGLFYIDTESAIHYYDLSIVFSGSTAPSTSAVWYDTANNKIIESRDDGVTWEKQGCLPLCIFTSNGTNIASIDQVFNYFGYMGSTVFILPGVKGLVSNGRNEDYTSKNTVFEVSRVLQATNLGEGSIYCPVFVNIDNTVARAYVYFEQETTPDITTTAIAVWFNPSENKHYWAWKNKSINEWTEYKAFNIGKITINSLNVITSVYPKTPFRAVDYNDYQSKITELETKIATLEAAVEALQGS